MNKNDNSDYLGTLRQFLKSEEIRTVDLLVSLSKCESVTEVLYLRAYHFFWYTPVMILIHELIYFSSLKIEN